jgi:hypothetical protein
MRTINFTLFAMLIGSYIAMIGATPIEGGSLAESIARRQDDGGDGAEYVPLQQQLQRGASWMF